jgi:hypothetical protein
MNYAAQVTVCLAVSAILAAGCYPELIVQSVQYSRNVRGRAQLVADSRARAAAGYRPMACADREGTYFIADCEEGHRPSTPGCPEVLGLVKPGLYRAARCDETEYVTCGWTGDGHAQCRRTPDVPSGFFASDESQSAAMMFAAEVQPAAARAQLCATATLVGGSPDALPVFWACGVARALECDRDTSGAVRCRFPSL